MNSDPLFSVDAEKYRAAQLALNCDWLVDKTDRIHAALCPGKFGTWQQRAEQAVKAAEDLRKAAVQVTPRLVRPLSKGGVADCPQCHSSQSVARHNADWTCYKCGYCEIVDDDREAERYGHLYGPNSTMSKP